VLSEFARTMVTDFPIQGILDHLVKRIVDVMPVSAAGVTLVSARLAPRYIAASNSSALRYERLQTALGDGPCLGAYETGDAVSVPDLGTESRFPQFVPEALAAGLTAVFAFPLRHGDLRLGALDLYRDTRGALSPDAMRAAQTLADVAAAYLINAQARADLQRSSDLSREAALHDPLTGLPNRALMLEMLDHAFRGSQRSGKTSAVFFIDLDHFKQVNDAYGHQVGDELLKTVAGRLTRALRPADSLARLSGDEFVVLCEDLDDASQADAVAARFHRELARPFELSGLVVQVTASIGIALTDHGMSAAEDLLHDADLAMYQSKSQRSGAGPVLHLRELQRAEHHDGLARSLHGAVDRGELHVEYQPIVDAADGRVTAVETLLRWTHPTRGLVAPSVFIPFAEQSGLITEIGQWVLEEALTDHHQWHHHRSAELGIAVNVSAHQLMSAGFPTIVATVLDTRSADPGLLTLEVTESVLVRDGERALVVLAELKDLGVKLALDDFGTGYSSLGYLNSLPVDTIKIDPTFIAKLTGKPDSQAIVSSIIQLAHTLGMTVVCEGVETTTQHEQLMRLGSDSCQGFYFARPMRAASLSRLLQHREDGIERHLPADVTADAAS
jgi:diguanylate cyclase (GGDEF)-like protein